MIKRGRLDIPTWPSLAEAAEDIKAKVKTVTHEEMRKMISDGVGLSTDGYRRVEIEGVEYDFAYSIVPMPHSGLTSHILTVYTAAHEMPEEEVAKMIAEAVLGKKAFENPMPSLFGPRRCFLRIEDPDKPEPQNDPCT